MRCVNVVIVGAGNVANTVHIPAWKKIKEANLIAICDIDKKRAENIARNWKIRRIYTDFAELLEKEGGR